MAGFNGYTVFFCILVLAGMGVAHAQPDPAAEREEPAAADIGAARQRLDELQRERGVYDPALTEAWSDLATQLAGNGEHEEAAESWREALQVNRINEGLYNESQLRIIERLAEAWEAADQPEEAETYHHLLFHTRSRLHDPDSIETVDAVVDWSEWKLQRSTERNGSVNPGRLSTAELNSLDGLQQQALETLRSTGEQDSGPPDDVRYGRLLHAQVLTGIGMASRILQEPVDYFNPPLTQQYITRRVCRTVATPSGGTQQVCSSQRVENPRYRQAQAVERSRQAERELHRARQILASLVDWQADSSQVAVAPGELADLERFMDRMERTVRRPHTFGRW